MASTSYSGSGPYTLIDRLAEEFAERFRRGERPSLKEFIDRHPELADEIQELFPALARLGQAEEQLRREESDDAPRPALHRLGDYRIVREIGRGGMGVVYEAEQVSLGRRVALKILPHHASQDRTSAERFRREARSAARLHHTNIVPVFEVGQDGDINFYAMQLIRGQGLDAVIAELRRLRALPPSGGPTPSIPAAQSAIVGPPAGEATLPGPPAAEVSQMARSLLTGRFVHGGAATTTIDESVRPGAWAVEPDMAEGGGGSGPVPGAEGDGLDASDPPPSRGRESVRAPAVPGRTDSSAVLPGGSQLSSPRHKQRPFYRSVAHVGLQASQALAYAHARGILHRDIKPSNLLLDAAGVVWVADFGLAKADDEGLTRTGDLLGTPRYMAPERFRGEGDARADLYALGLTLYEMLTLRPAFESSDRLRLIERIKSEEPTRPRSLDARIPRDLETIVAKATEKDPRRRYGSADELAEDLRRFLGGEPIRARRVGEAEKAWKWARRRPALSATLALLAASMVAGTAISVTFAVRANRNAMKATERASATRLAQADAEEARDRAERFERAARLQSAGLLLDHGLGLAGRGEVGPGLFWMLEALRTAPADAMDLRRVIRVNLAAWGRRLTRLRAVIPCESVVQGVAIRPDGSMIASGHADDRVRRWDPLTGREIGPPLGEAGHREGPFAVHFSPDGGTLFAAHADRIQRYDPATGERMGRRWDVLMTDEGATTPGRLLIRPDGGLIIATAGGAARFAYLDPRAEGLLDASVRVQAGEPGLSRFLPDNRLFVVREAKGEGLEITLWDSEGRRRLAGPWTSPPGIVTVSPDGRSYYRVSSIERSGRFWIEQFDMATGRAVGIPTEIPATRQGPIWTPDGRVALLVNGVGRVRVFVPIDATVPDPFRPLDERAVAVSPTGRWFVVARTDHLAVFEPGDDWTDTIAQLAVGPAAAGVENETPRIAASPDRTTELLPLCVEPGAVEVVLREADSGRPIGPGLRIPVEGDAPPITAVFSPSGRLVAVASGMTTRLLDAHSGASIGPPLVHDDTATCLAFSPDGDMLAVGHPGGGVGLWDVETGRPARAPLAIPGAVREVEFFPGGRLAIRSDSARPGAEVVRLWDSGGGRPIGPEIALDGDDDLVYSPDGDRLMRLGKNTVRFVETRTGRAAGEPHQLFREHIRRSQGVSAAAFAGDRLGVIGTGKGTIRLFDATSGRPIPGMEMSHPGRAPVLGLAVSPDGRSALTGHLDGTACLWDLTTSRAMGPPIRACREVVAVAFSPDGRWAMLISPRGRTWRWPVPGPIDADPDLLGLRLELETGVRLAPGPTAVELTARQWLERRDRLMSLGADPSSPLFPRPEDLEWHAFRAFEANEADAIETAAWHLEVLSRLRPGDWTIPARIGAMLADAGRPGRASAVIDRAEADAEAGEVASWYRLRALEALASRRFEAALRDLDRALARVPDDARALADRALSRSALGDDAGADADTALAVALAEDGDLLVLLGSRLAAAGRWEEARVPFARAVATAPLTHFERERAALTLLRAGDSEAFRLLVDRLIEDLREPQASPTRLLVEARPGLLGPTNPEQAGRISAILDRECGRLARRPDVPAELRHAIHSAAGAALYRAGRHAEAVDRLEEGIASGGGPASPMDLAFLAMAHQALGRLDLARRHLDRLDGAEPTHDFWDAQEYWTLRREAESVIRPDLGFPGDPFDRD